MLILILQEAHCKKRLPFLRRVSAECIRPLARALPCRASALPVRHGLSERGHGRARLGHGARSPGQL
eukprot:9084447-Lingulodinium_polyedra.AAC.1